MVCLLLGCLPCQYTHTEKLLKTLMMVDWCCAFGASQDDADTESFLADSSLGGLGAPRHNKEQRAASSMPTPMPTPTPIAKT